MEKIDKIVKFEKVIEENKTSFLQIIILYNMKCHCNYLELTDKEKERLLSVIYAIYLKDETNADLARFSDIVMENYKKILEFLENGEHEQAKNIIYNNL